MASDKCDNRNVKFCNLFILCRFGNLYSQSVSVRISTS